MSVSIYKLSWQNTQVVDGIQYVCGFCGTFVGPRQGYFTAPVGDHQGFVLLCNYCNRPTFIDRERETNMSITPSAKMGKSIDYLPPEVEAVYEEARLCTSAGAYTAAVMLCRKLLMNTAVHEGADEGQKFVRYVNYLASKNLFPPNSKKWVDYILKKGNEANHEIVEMTAEDAENLITFSAMLLNLVYEFPKRLLAKDDPEEPGS